MDRPLVSTVVPVYNGERYLATALDSIFQQDYRPLEVIVVDDGSTDRSAEIAQSYQGLSYIYQSNAGVAVARNTGIAAARGEFIAFLDQDDWWAPNKLRLQVAALREHLAAGYALAREQIHLEPGIGWPAWIRREAVLNGELICLPGTWLVRRTVFDQIGAFDPRYVLGCDTEWLVRARDAGITRIVVPEVLLYWRIHDANESYKQRVSRIEFFRILKSTIDRKRNSVLPAQSTSLSALGRETLSPLPQAREPFRP